MTVSLMPMPKQAFYAVDNSGRYRPLVGGKVYTYVGGTVSTPKATYTDSTGATQQANPVILDSRGEASIWLGPGSYKIVLKDANDVTIWTVDGVTGASMYSVVTTTNELESTPGIFNGQIAKSLGYWSAGDGGHGEYRWDAASTASENGGTIIQATGASTGRWILLHDGSVDVRQFGAKTDGTNASTAIQAALNSGVGHVTISAYHYMTTAVAVSSNTTVEWIGDGDIEFDGTGSVFTTTGTLGTLYTLAANVARGDTSFTVGAGQGGNFAANNVVWLQAEDDALSYAGHKKAELLIVDSVAGDVVTVKGCIADSYTTANTAKAGVVTAVQSVRYVNPRIYNKKWTTATTTATGAMILAYFTRDLSIIGGFLRKNNAAGFVPLNCMSVIMDGAVVEDMRDDIGNSIYGYGIEPAGATINCNIIGCTFSRCRHGVTTGTASGGPTPNYGVQRGITVSGCTFVDCTHTSLDTHDDSDGVTFTGNTIVRGAIVGIATRGWRTTISGNTVMNINGNGIYVDGSARDTTISGNTIAEIRQTGNTAGEERGHGMRINGQSTTISGNHIYRCDNFGLEIDSAGVLGRDVMITGNIIQDNGLDPSSTWAGVTAGIHCDFTANRLVINGNVVSDSQTSKTQNYGIWLTANVGAFSPVNVSGNVLDNNATGPWLNQSSGSRIVGSGNSPKEAIGGETRLSTTTGSVAATTQVEITVSLGFTALSTDYQINHYVIGTDLELRNVTAQTTTNYKVMVYNRGAGPQTGTIISFITNR